MPLFVIRAVVRLARLALALSATAAGPAPMVTRAGTAPPAVSAATDPGSLPQTTELPATAGAAFAARTQALWRGIVTGTPGPALPAFFPRGAYRQVKSLADADGDYRHRLLVAFAQDIAAAHRLLGAGAQQAALQRVVIPRQWAWIPAGYCTNQVGYWHAPGARLVYREHGEVRSFGIFSFISWRGQWYVIHLAPYNHPGTVIAPTVGPGTFGPPGSC